MFSVLPPVPAVAEPTAAGNVALTMDPGIDARNSPTVVLNPTDPTNLVVAERVDRPTYSAGIHYSLDGGQTWATGEFPVPEGLDRPFAPDLAFGDDGTLYLEFVNLEGQGNSPGAVWVARSLDGGARFSAPSQALGAYAFQVRMAIDTTRDPDRLWLTWLQADSDAVTCINCFTRTGLPILAARSDDGGMSWSDPVQVSDPARGRVGAPVPGVAPDGNLVVLFYDFDEDRIDWENLEGTYQGSFQLVLSKSSVDLTTFEESVVDDGVVAPDRFLPYIPTFPSLSVGPDGELYAAWHDARNGDWDVFVSRSNDRGESWSVPTRVNDDEVGNGRHQYLPRLAVAPDGRLDVAFYDRRGDPNNLMTELFLAYSDDGGRSFGSNVRLSDQSFSSDVGPEHVGTGGDFGSRIGLVSAEDRALAVWTDTRNGSVASARQDIYAGVVTGLPGGGGGVLVPVFALVAGMVAGMGGLLMIAARRRRVS